MEKDVLAAKVKELRNSKGYSQEYLSEVAQVSLRTVQRIENGETVARGDTLNRLAKALEVSVAALTEHTPTDNNSYLALMNLSALAFLVFIKFPLLSFIVPLILWLYKRDELINVRERGKQILNFQITWCLTFTIYFMVFVVFSMFLNFHIIQGIYISHLTNLDGPEIILVTLVLFMGFNVLMIIINTILLLMNKDMKYWPVYRFLK